MANAQPTPPSGELKPTGTLEIKDSRTDKNYSVQIVQGGVEGDTATRAMDLRQIKTSPEEFGLMTYDPAFMNTASCKSAITFIDGDKGILRYRGYPIEQLAEHGDFLETCYLLLFGELPTAAQKADFVKRVTNHTMVHEQMSRFFQGFRRDAHPMAVMVGSVGALSAFYHDSTDISDPHQRLAGTGQLFQALQGKGQMGAALIGKNRMQLVNDHVTDRTQNPPCLRREEQKEGFRSRDQDLWRPAQHPLAFGGWCIAGTDCGLKHRQIHPHPLCGFTDPR